MVKIVGILAILILMSGCTPRLDSEGCWGYSYESGLLRGTREANRNYVSPYRQCVSKETMQDLHREQEE